MPIKIPDEKREEIFNYFLSTGASQQELQDKFNPGKKGLTAISKILTQKMKNKIYGQKY